MPNPLYLCLCMSFYQPNRVFEQKVKRKPFKGFAVGKLPGVDFSKEEKAKRLVINVRFCFEKMSSWRNRFDSVI